MTRIMRDALYPSNIPSGTPMAASYIDHPLGGWGVGTGPQERQRLLNSGSQIVDIATQANHVADFLDSQEPGDAPLNAIPGWVRLCLSAGKPLPVVYCNQSQRPATQQLLDSTGLPYGLGIAAPWRQLLSDMRNVVFVQWYFPGSYDESIVYNDSWLQSLSPFPLPPITPSSKSTFFILGG